MEKREKQRRGSVGVRSVALLAVMAVTGAGLAAWKLASAQRAEAAAANQPEAVEVVAAAFAVPREHRAATTSIGTVLATRSVVLRNELAGTVREVRLAPGQVVDAGELLVALDVSVEEAELRALRAQAELAETTLARHERMHERRAISAIELDNARAERDVALAQIERTRAIIARKTIRAPFRARVGIADVHPGQFLDAGTLLTTLQGVDDAVNVDFAVSQSVAEGLRPGEPVEVFLGDGASAAITARILAIDARVDPATRNAAVRARIERGGSALSPGASVRVRVPVGVSTEAVAIPVNAVRKGPAGDHVFVLEPAENGLKRAHVRQVRAGPSVGDEILILDGIRAGEEVAATGSFKLYEGVLVHVDGEEVATADVGR